MPKKKLIWTQTDEGKVKLFTADPRVKEGGVGKVLFLVVAILIKRGVPPTRVVELCSLAAKMYITNAGQRVNTKGQNENRT